MVVARQPAIFGESSSGCPLIRTAKNDYYSFVTDKLWQHGIHGAKKEGQAVSGGDCRQGVGAGACGHASGREGCSREKEEAGKAQAYAGQIIGRVGIAGQDSLLLSLEGRVYGHVRGQRDVARVSRGGAARPSRGSSSGTRSARERNHRVQGENCTACSGTLDGS
jgi:hypothetical protein